MRGFATALLRALQGLRSFGCSSRFSLSSHSATRQNHHQLAYSTAMAASDSEADTPVFKNVSLVQLLSPSTRLLILSSLQDLIKEIFKLTLEPNTRGE